MIRKQAENGSYIESHYKFLRKGDRFIFSESGLSNNIYECTSDYFKDTINNSTTYNCIRTIVIGTFKNTQDLDYV